MRMMSRFRPARKMMAGRRSFAVASHTHLDTIKARQEEWGNRLVALGKMDEAVHEAEASKLLSDMYAFEDGHPVLFKPTLAAEMQFRGTTDLAKSYFITGSVPEDDSHGGFALKGWENVRFDNSDLTMLGDNHAMAMGNYFFTPPGGGDEVKVEYSFVYVNVDGTWKIQLQHSSFPYGH